MSRDAAQQFAAYTGAELTATPVQPIYFGVDHGLQKEGKLVGVICVRDADALQQFGHSYKIPIFLIHALFKIHKAGTPAFLVLESAKEKSVRWFRVNDRVGTLSIHWQHNGGNVLIPRELFRDAG